MSRLVGSPNALVIAATAAEKSAPDSGTSRFASRIWPRAAFSMSSTGSTPGILPIEIVLMPTTQSDVPAALRAIPEPALRRSIVDLGLVRDIKTSRRGVELTVALLDRDEPGVDQMVAEVRAAVAGINGVR